MGDIRTQRSPFRLPGKLLGRYTRSVTGARLFRGLLLVPVLAAFAQAPPAEAPALRGVLLECDAHPEGEFAVRGPGNEVVRYRFDAKTRVERAGVPTSFPLVRAGEVVEVSSTPIADSPLRYAALVKAVDPVAPHMIDRPARQAPLPPTLAQQPLFRRGDLTFSGVVSFLGSGRLILRTRNGGEHTILLRQDTRYLSSGGRAASSDLKANMRIFVRAGKDFYGNTEAYQVVWGGYLQP